MPTHTHTCITLTCDVCTEPYAPEDYTVHFDSITDAISHSRTSGWTATAEGRVVCSLQDNAHRAAITDLLPPEPVFQAAGQLSLEEDTGHDH
ncbi:hypothetical protein OEIGOIKO_05809 [Streptomyces chrestomyceticus JCM 4735]|uniref:Uncharacterized protein n=1 Tax=Streptomyces chrestomyceticus JCM 4735 TaxID=1306181 RepID=A0A7U9KYZ7_9ACTN|nr:hypothetical protein [Streptomyces chrestomyceticus]GCD37999.1 hypothetical protein OEIGOIKO_05809 [Streptomyces chrestomyceticus JCM 4735]